MCFHFAPHVYKKIDLDIKFGREAKTKCYTRLDIDMINKSDRDIIFMQRLQSRKGLNVFNSYLSGTKVIVLATVGCFYLQVLNVLNES